MKSPFDPPEVPNSRFEKDPFQLKDPFSNAKPMTPNDTDQRCPFCECKLSNVFMDGEKCPNCNTTIGNTKDYGVPPHAVTPRNPNKGVNPTFIPQNTPINASFNFKNARSKRDKGHAKHDKETVKDTYFSEPFDQCTINMERRKPRINDDKKIEVMRSCSDLEIDG